MTRHGSATASIGRLTGLLLMLSAAPTLHGLDVAPMENVEVRAERMTVQLREREWLLMRPREAVGETPAPLLVMLHFLNGLNVEMANLTGVAALVRLTGVWVAVPQAIGGRWDAGTALSLGKPYSDVRFLEAMIDDLAARYPLDLSRVYMAGYSNGALMAEHFACQRPERLAGLGLIASTSPTSTVPSCAPARGVPLVMFHGDEDEVVPYDGSLIRRSAPETAAVWAERLGCGGATQVENLPVRINDGTDVFVERFTACADGEVALFTIEGGGHTYPGALGFSPELGRATQNLNATIELWRFFERFSRAQE